MRRASAMAGLLLLCVSGTLRAQGPPIPAPGRLIDVGGWRLHLNCSGEARPSRPIVALEAGAGDFSVDWSLVQPGVARVTRVCSYDRAGSGWSELGPRPRTMRQIVYELHALLEKAGERPPYVLVGHSYGGALARVYHGEYPADVVGMVLVEGAFDNPWRVRPGEEKRRASELATGQPVPPVKTSDPLRESQIPPRIVTLIEGQLPEQARHANDPPRDKLAPDAQRMRSWSLAQLKMGVSNDNPAEADELTALFTDRMKRRHPFGDLPLIVISRGRETDEEHTRDQASLVGLSSVGKQVIAERSGHHVPLDEPDVVVSAIRRIVQPFL